MLVASALSPTPTMPLPPLSLTDELYLGRMSYSGLDKRALSARAQRTPS